MSAAEKKRLIKAVAITAAFILIAASVALLMAHIGRGIPCIFYEITGLRCPGCGNTRAAMAILNFDFKRAFSVNALFPVEFGYILYMYTLLCFNYIKKGKTSLNSPPSWKWIDITALVLIVGWGIVRNIFGW